MTTTGHRRDPVAERERRGAPNGAARIPPRAKGHALLLAYHHWREPLDFLLGLWREFGDVFVAPLPGFGDVTYVASPELVSEVFRTPSSLLVAGAANAMALAPALGAHALLTLDGDEHRRHRRLLNPGLHTPALDAHEDAIRAITNRAVDRMPIGRPVAMYPIMEHIAIEVSARSIFGVRDASGVAQLCELIRDFTNRSHVIMILPFLRRSLGPFGPWARFERARDALDDFIYATIRAQRASASAATDDASLLSVLAAATDDSGRPMTDREIRDELVALIFAGHVTTATALAWVWERLVHSGDAMARLCAAVDAGTDDYLDATIRETLRSRPVVSEVWRRSTTELELGGYVVPEGTIVSPALAVLHHREDLYPEPERFRPERFLEADSPSVWVPFGGGTRRCIGGAFAEFEMSVVIATVLRRLQLVAARPSDEKIVLKHMALAPARGAEVVVAARKAPA